MVVENHRRGSMAKNKEIKNQNSGNFFPKGIFHLTYLTFFLSTKRLHSPGQPSTVPLSHTFSGCFVLFATYGRKLHFPNSLTNWLPGRVGLRETATAAGRTGAGKGSGSLIHFPSTHQHLLQGCSPFQRVLLPVSGNTCNSHAPCSPRGGFLLVAANLWVVTWSLVHQCHLFCHLQTQFSVVGPLVKMPSPVILTDMIPHVAPKRC